MATTIATDCAGEPALARVGALVTRKLLDSQATRLRVPFHPHISSSFPSHPIRIILLILHHPSISPLPLCPQREKGGVVWTGDCLWGLWRLWRPSHVGSPPGVHFRPVLGVGSWWGSRAGAGWSSCVPHPWPYPRLFWGTQPLSPYVDPHRVRRTLDCL